MLRACAQNTYHWLKETGERTGSSSYLDWDKGCWEAGHTAAVEAGMCAALGMERSAAKEAELAVLRKECLAVLLFSTPLLSLELTYNC